MNVSVLAHTPHPDVLIKAAFGTCYSPRTPQELYELAMEEESNAPSVVSAFIKDKLSTGHDSPLEHSSISFAISGISRTCSHQLVRHRIASYSQQSQRYVKEKNAASPGNNIVPPTIAAIPEALAKFQNAMDVCAQAYSELVSDFGIPAEDARFLFTNAKATNVVVTMNYRSLLHFFSLRCCTRAQWEIRTMAYKMLVQARKVNPLIFENAGASCVLLGYCPENDKFSCGRAPTLTKLREAAERNK